MEGSRTGGDRPGRLPNVTDPHLASHQHSAQPTPPLPSQPPAPGPRTLSRTLPRVWGPAILTAMGFSEDLARAAEKLTADQRRTDDAAAKAATAEQVRARALERLLSESAQPAARHLTAAGIPVQALFARHWDRPEIRVPGGGWGKNRIAISVDGGLYLPDYGVFIEQRTETRAARKPPKRTPPAPYTPRYSREHPRTVFEKQGDRGIKPGETVIKVEPFNGSASRAQFVTADTASIYNVAASELQDPAGEFFLRTDQGRDQDVNTYASLRALIAEEVLALTQAHQR